MSNINSCRICMEEDNTSSNPLISPCKCKGSMKYIHRNCLNNWRNTNNIAFYECDICKYKYQFIRSTIASILRNEYIILLITMFTFIVISFILGLFIAPKLSVAGTLSKYVIHNIIFGGIIMGCIGFISLILSFFTYLTPRAFDNNIHPPNTSDGMNIMLIIMVILGIFYILYNTYMIVHFIVYYNLSNVEHMVENVN